jgi:hypothetical protein
VDVAVHARAQAAGKQALVDALERIHGRVAREADGSEMEVDQGKRLAQQHL